MNNIEIFNFEGKQIRMFILENEIWAVAKDAAKLLGYENTAKAIRDHCKNTRSASDFLKVNDSFTFDLHPQTLLINEADINRLVFSSKLPQAETIRDWWFEEVLPTIRKTGSYSLQPQLTTEKVLNAYAFFETSLKTAKLIQHDHNQAVASANKVTKQVTGTNVLELLGATHLIPKITNPNELLTPTELGKLLNLSARKVNSLLELASFQSSYRDDKGRLQWALTETGRKYGAYCNSGRKQTNSSPIRQIKWCSEVANQLELV